MISLFFTTSVCTNIKKGNRITNSRSRNAVVVLYAVWFLPTNAAMRNSRVNMLTLLSVRGLRYYRIGIESPIFLEKSIVSVSYQYRNSWTGKYRISISIDFSSWKVSVSVSVSPFSKMSIKFSITPNYTLFWILKCNKNGYFHYFW